MNSEAIKSNLHDRMMDLDAEQFEQFSKILIEQVEEPPHIELTPFGADGGIDVRGSYGHKFFDAHFGVQSKRYSSNVGSGKLRNFVGALTHHKYQFGCFVTTAGYSNGAIEIAEDEAIVLIDGDRLTDIMIVNEIGVEFDDSDYNLDYDFWEIFEETEEDDLVETDEVPQADSFAVIHATLLAIDSGHRFNPEIKDFLDKHTDHEDWTRRQADYYPSAAYILGFVHGDKRGEYNGREMRRWGLTRAGQEYIQLLREGNEDARKEHLHDQIRETEIIKRILDDLKEKGTIDYDELGNIIHQESKLNDTTADRRRVTVSKWLTELPEVTKRTEGQSYRFDYVNKKLTDYT